MTARPLSRKFAAASPSPSDTMRDVGSAKSTRAAGKAGSELDYACIAGWATIIVGLGVIVAAFFVG